MPTSPWKKGAPFPEPDEELYGVAANGKTVRDWRLERRQGWGRQLRVRPRHRQVDEETADAEAGAPCGAGRCERQDLRDGWLRAAGGHRSPARRRMAADRQRVAIRSGRRFLEVAAAAAHEARLRGGGRSRRQDLRDRWRDDDGRAVLDDSRGRLGESKDPFFTAFGPSRVLSVNEVYDPATNKWETRQPMSVPRNHAFGAAVNGKIYVIGGRTGHGFILTATNTDVVEEYDPVSDSWSAPKERMPTARSGGVSGTDGRRIYVAGGEVTTQQLVGAFRAIEAYDPLTNSWITLPPMPMPRHGVAGAVIGNRLSPGERDDPVRRGAGVPRPDARNPHGERTTSWTCSRSIRLRRRLRRRAHAAAPSDSTHGRCLDRRR